MMALRRHIIDCITTTSTVELAADDVYHILSSPRRRQLLLALDDHDSEIAHLGELAERLATQEADGGGFDAVRISLHQSHLPQLDAAGVVEWDRDTGAVIPCEPASVLASIVRDVDERIEGRPDQQ